MSVRPVLRLAWRGIQTGVCVSFMLIAGSAAIAAGWAAAMRAGNLGDKVVWTGAALLSALLAAWFARDLIGFLRIWRGKGRND
ncbi:hypothetical protein [Falsiroseomonas sp.]|uniref:hypothetical protein n=1 Tax=Falsiroseomonas sp. TaxID=2870721 RepID=UPI003568FE5B